MTIIIFTQKTNTDMDTQIQTREAHIWITNNTTNYVMDVGNLTMTGSLQSVLNGMESDLFTLAAGGGGHIATATENEIAGAITYYIADPGMKAAVFDSTVASLDTSITAIVNAITGLSAAQKTGLRRALMASIISVRIDAHDRGLV